MILYMFTRLEIWFGRERIPPACRREITGEADALEIVVPFQQNQRGNREIHSRTYRDLENAGESG